MAEFKPFKDFVDPRVNIQSSKGGRAKTYQVRQVLAAIDKLEKIKK